MGKTSPSSRANAAWPPPMLQSRRACLGTMAGLAAAAISRPVWAATDTSTPETSQRAISALYASLSPRQRQEVCFPWDQRVDIRYARKPLWMPDPNGILLRTHVSNAWLITSPLLGSDFYSDEQRGLILDVMRATLTPEWTAKLQQQAKDDSGRPWGGEQALALFGDPTNGPCTAAITGFHLTVRATTDPQPRSAFGGGITHGHQPSGFYEKLGHPGNIFWPQALQANEIYRLLDASQRRGALVKEHMPFFQYQGEIDRTVVQPGTNWDEPRRESDIRFRAPGSGTPGLPVKEFSSEQRQALEGLLASLLEPYRAHYQNQVRDCIAQQGGLEQLTLAFYQERDMGGDEVWDNWRLEGPSFVWFFRGAPHVHLWIHVARDPQAPITSYFG